MTSSCYLSDSLPFSFANRMKKNSCVYMQGEKIVSSFYTKLEPWPWASKTTCTTPLVNTGVRSGWDSECNVCCTH